MPAAEVSNRTIMMSLVSLPFRVTLGAPRSDPYLGTYKYIGREWPDVWKLNTSTYFEQFAVVGLALNSLMLVGLFVFCSSLGANSVLPLAAMSGLVSTIYSTWRLPRCFPSTLSIWGRFLIIGCFVCPACLDW